MEKALAIAFLYIIYWSAQLKVKPSSSRSLKELLYR